MIAINARPGPRERTLRHHHWLHPRPNGTAIFSTVRSCGITLVLRHTPYLPLPACETWQRQWPYFSRSFLTHRYQKLRAMGGSRISLNHFRAAAQGRMHSWGKGVERRKFVLICRLAVLSSGNLRRGRCKVLYSYLGFVSSIVGRVCRQHLLGTRPRLGGDRRARRIVMPAFDLAATVTPFFKVCGSLQDLRGRLGPARIRFSGPTTNFAIVPPVCFPILRTSILHPDRPLVVL